MFLLATEGCALTGVRILGGICRPSHVPRALPSLGRALGTCMHGPPAASHRTDISTLGRGREIGPVTFLSQRPRSPDLWYTGDAKDTAASVLESTWHLD